MPLPILNQRGASSPADLLRLFLKTENLWCEHLAELEQIDLGTAFANPNLPDIHNANNIRDVSLPEDLTPQQALDQVTAHFQSKSTTCHAWTLNPSASESRNAPLTDLLLSTGHRETNCDVLMLDRSPQSTITEIAGLRIIPARASFRHMRQLLEECTAGLPSAPQLIEAAMLHLDDPHYDPLLALRADQPVACIGVFAVGDVGRIEQVYVSPSHRNQGIGRTMMSRAIEICARSLFRIILIGVDPDNAPAHTLYQKFGFHPVGQITTYRLP